MKTIALYFGVIWLVGGAFITVGWAIWDTWRNDPVDGAIAASLALISLAAIAAIVYGTHG